MTVTIQKLDAALMKPPTQTAEARSAAEQLESEGQLRHVANEVSRAARIAETARTIDSSTNLPALLRVKAAAKRVSNFAWNTPVESKREYLEVSQSLIGELDTAIAELEKK